jgi:hypothetical protein
MFLAGGARAMLAEMREGQKTAAADEAPGRGY